ncbi:MAG: hypothetical protein CMH83_02940 [Nocardioides sp.]|nr:hypothetical protein [Nocardioides sp.]
MTGPLPTWDESARPTTTTYDDADPGAVARGDHLRQIHDMYRQGLDQVAAALDTAVAARDDEAASATALGEARSGIHALGAPVRTAGSWCGQLCRAVEQHHRIEDAVLYPALRAADDGLAAVLDRLGEEHDVVHALLGRLDDALVVVAREPGDPAHLDALVKVYGHFRTLLESHFRYEESQIGTALGVHHVMV